MDFFTALRSVDNPIKDRTVSFAICDQLRGEMREAFVRRYWSESRKAYVIPDRRGIHDELVQSLAIVAGLAPKRRWNDLADFLETDTRCSICLEAALLRKGCLGRTNSPDPITPGVPPEGHVSKFDYRGTVFMLSVA